jgi:hypothetical protein
VAYSVDWDTKVISVPSTDLVLVTGSQYRLSLSAFHKEIRRLEWELNEGLSQPQILDHTNPKTIAGVTYAPFDEVINGYTVTFTGGIQRVDLVDSNNNIVDVLNYNGVSVVPSNSGGLIIGQGADSAAIATAVWDKVLP